MKALLLLACVALAACQSPTEPAQQSCEVTDWQPAVTAQGDTVAWYGICTWVTK
jgi:hypothetical protein